MPRPDRAPFQSRKIVRDAVYEIRSIKNHRKHLKEATKRNGNHPVPTINNLPRSKPDV